jgi:DNA-binding MarR family transcriptional regulator
MKLRDEIKQTKPFEGPQEEAFLNLQRTAEFLRAKAAEALKPWGLSATQYNALRILRGAGRAGLACSEIGMRMVTQDSDITRLLDRLEKKGLILRSRGSKDRRVVTARATRQALALLAQMDEPMRTSAQTVMGGLSAGELHDLTSYLERLRK